MKPSLIGFAVGILVGCVGLLLAQTLTKSESDESLLTEEAKTTLAQKRNDQELVAALDEIDLLKAKLAGTQDPETIAVAGDTPAPEVAKGEPEPEEQAASFLKAMMSLGNEKEKREIEKRVEALAERLGLSENQQSVLRDALLAKAAAQRDAGLKLLTGKATIADLIASDEHNFLAVDAALTPVLDAEQLDEYATYQGERESERIQKKTEEDLEGLMGIGTLSEQQEEEAWQIFAEINTGERPGDVPPDTTVEQFHGIIDEAINKRVDALAPILDGEQLKAYQVQTEEFRTMVTTLVGHATGTGAPAEE